SGETVSKRSKTGQAVKKYREKIEEEEGGNAGKRTVADGDRRKPEIEDQVDDPEKDRDDHEPDEHLLARAGPFERVVDELGAAPQIAAFPRLRPGPVDE